MSASDQSSIGERLSRLFRGKASDDPLSSLKAVTRWTDGLALGDPMKAHGDVLAEVKRFNDENLGQSREAPMVLMLLDEKSQDLQSALARQYLRNPRMSRVVESGLWHAIYQLNWEILRGYHKLIFGHFRNESSTRMAPMVPLMTLRALRCFRHVIKWRAIRYMHAGDQTWARLHQLYQIAENQKFHKTLLPAYPNDKRESSCEAEYVRILLLEQANSGSLFPRQFDLIDQWLGNWGDIPALEATLNIEHHTLAVDLTRDRGPRRVRNSGGPELATRYCSTLDLLNRLRNIQADIHGGIDPARLGLTDHVRAAEALELIDHLIRQWGPLTSREQRRSPRTAVKRIVEIAHGFPTIVRLVRETRNNRVPLVDDLAAESVEAFPSVNELGHDTVSAVANTLTPDSTRELERWVMEDESECGYGTTIQSRERDWLRIGALTCLRRNGENRWSLGIVRRLSRLNDLESSVGIETLPGEPMLVQIEFGQGHSAYMINGEDAYGGLTSIAGLILNEGNAPEIVLNPSHYQRGGLYEYSAAEGRKTIQLGDPVEQSEGWLRCKINWV